MSIRSYVLMLAATVLISNSMAEEFKRSELGFTLGWGAPVGEGVEYAYYLAEPLNLNAGVGFTMSGGKFSIGSKYFFMSQNSASPFIGLNMTKSTGLSSVKVTVNNDSAKYSIEKAVFMTPRVGWRFKTRTVNFYVNTGYGIILSGGGTKFVSGSTASSVKDFADVISAGGFEISGSLMFKF